MTTTGIDMRNSEIILTYIYFYLLDESGAARDILVRMPAPVRLALPAYTVKFVETLSRVYGNDILERLRRHHEKRAPDTGGCDEHMAEPSSAGGVRTTESALECLSGGLENALDFLFAFNTAHEIIRELLPRLPDPEEAFAIKQTIEKATCTPEHFSLLAASVASSARPEGYILKNREFQGYTFSIYREADERYTFEFISRQESFKGKIVHVSIIPLQGEPLILEEECFIDTRHYSLAYQGMLSGDADIKPAVISMD